MTRATLDSYNFDAHSWDKGGCCNPALIPEWRTMLSTLRANPDRYEATTDGGWPRVGWRDVLAVEMHRTWPYNHDVPSVLLTGWDGAHWTSIMSLSEIREKSPPASSAGDRS